MILNQMEPSLQRLSQEMPGAVVVGGAGRACSEAAWLGQGSRSPPRPAALSPCLGSPLWGLPAAPLSHYH